jgi:hypothetical protein
MSFVDVGSSGSGFGWIGCPTAEVDIALLTINIIFTRCDKVVPGLGATNLLLLLPVSEFWSFYTQFSILLFFCQLFWQLFDNFLATFWQLFDNFLTTYWQLFENKLTTFFYNFLRFFAFFLTTFWQLFWQLLKPFGQIKQFFFLVFFNLICLCISFSLSLHPNCRNWSPNYSVLVSIPSHSS